MLIPVILSGGAGTRLWPVSRSAYPKPFMRMADGESLLYKTLDRALHVADDGRVLTVTGRDYYFLTRDAYAQHAGANLDQLPFLLEPAGSSCGSRSMPRCRELAWWSSRSTKVLSRQRLRATQCCVWFPGNSAGTGHTGMVN